MELNQLRKFIKNEAKRIKEYYGHLEKQNLILASTVKLTEELGELCQEILAHQSIQRKEKLSKYNKDNLAEEFADVIITPMILAEWMGIDIEAALEKKMKIITKRYYPGKKEFDIQKF